MVPDEFDEEDETIECPTCGATIPADASECPKCGQEFEEESDEDFEEGAYEQAECPTCGAMVPADASECPECGQVFEDEEEYLWEEEEYEEYEEEAPSVAMRPEEPDEELEEWGAFLDERPGKGKLYLGLILIFIGGFGLGVMSWLHNQIEWYPLVENGWAGYGPYDQITGGVGTVITIIGVLLIFLWYKAVREYEESLEEAKEEEMPEEAEFYEEQIEEPVQEEEFYEEEDLEEESYDDEKTLVKEEEQEEIPEECPNCEATLTEYEDITECPECGETLIEEEESEDEEEEEEDDLIRCPNCGTMNDQEAEFCSNCEQDLSGGTRIWSEEE